MEDPVVQNDFEWNRNWPGMDQVDLDWSLTIFSNILGFKCICYAWDLPLCDPKFRYRKFAFPNLTYLIYSIRFYKRCRIQWNCAYRLSYLVGKFSTLFCRNELFYPDLNSCDASLRLFLSLGFILCWPDRVPAHGDCNYSARLSENRLQVQAG